MKKLESKKRYVLPGDFITTAPLRLQDNVVLEGKRIISTTIGLSDVSADSVRVISLNGIYMPKMDDLVIGTIQSIFGMYIPVSEITRTLSVETSDSPIVVEITRFPSNTTLSCNRSGEVVIKSPGSTCRFLDSNFFNCFHLKYFEFFLQY